jgi:hypothetical protein
MLARAWLKLLDKTEFSAFQHLVGGMMPISSTEIRSNTSNILGG